MYKLNSSRIRSARRPAGFRRGLLAFGIVASLAVVLSGCDDGPSAPENLTTCSQVASALEEELTLIQSCSEADDCGQVLTGTSCGCTRNLVARRGADTGPFYTIVAQGQQLGCSATDFVSTCDCPAADGFACEQSTCTWNYVGG